MAAKAGARALRKMHQAQRREVERHFRELEVCTSKGRFTTEEGAEGALAATLIFGTTPKKPTQTYSCSVCGGWHLTSKLSAKGR